MGLCRSAVGRTCAIALCTSAIVLGFCACLVLAQKDEAGSGGVPSVHQIMTGAVDWIHAQGPVYGPLYYMLFLGVWVMLLLPCSILEMVPGYLFGFRTGVIVSIFGKNLGTICSLVIARYFLKDLIQGSILKRYPKLIALEEAVKREGFAVIVMIRVTYLPMLIKNYGLACLDIPLLRIWYASLFASIPFASLWTALGASATNLGDIMDGKLKARDILPDDLTIIGPAALVGMVTFLYFFRRLTSRFTAIMAELEAEKENEGKKDK